MKPFYFSLLLAGVAVTRLQAGALAGHAWGANVGWLSPQPTSGWIATAGGVHVLFGPLYSANCGWVTLGDGTPADGSQYANSTGEDSGVNRLADGSLRGLAWSANLGWIQFEATGNPRLDLNTGQFSGYAWIANAGWLNLDGLAVGGQAPAPQPNSFSRALNSSLKLSPAQLLANDSPTGGAELVLVSVQDPLPAGAAVNLAEGWIFYVPPAGYAGVGSFTYTVQNADNLLGTALVTITVAANPDSETGNRIAFALQPGGTVLLRYTGIPGRTYAIQATPNLAPPVEWTTLGSSVADANGIFEWFDTDAPNHPQQFYRTEAPANP